LKRLGSGYGHAYGASTFTQIKHYKVMND